MANRLIMIAVFGVTVASVYGISMKSTPYRGWTKALESLAGGVLLCMLCYAAAAPFGLKVPQTPFAALCAGCFGVPGAALATFLTAWP